MKTLCDDLSCLLIDCKNVTFAFVQSKMVDYILGVSDPIKWHSAVSIIISFDYNC